MALRERKKLQTRKALYEAALSLVATQGYDATTVDQIAAKGGVSRRTFFRYFGSKEAVFFPHQDARVARFRELLKDPEGSAFGRVKRAFMAMAEEYMSDRDELLQQQEVIASSSSLLAYELKLDKEWEAMVAEVLIDGHRDEEQHLATIQAGAVIGAIRATLRGWFEGRGEQDLRRLGALVFDLLAHGFEARDGATVGEEE